MRPLTRRRPEQAQQGEVPVATRDAEARGNPLVEMGKAPVHAPAGRGLGFQREPLRRVRALGDHHERGPSDAPDRIAGPEPRVGVERWTKCEDQVRFPPSGRLLVLRNLPHDPTNEGVAPVEM